MIEASAAAGGCKRAEKMGRFGLGVGIASGLLDSWKNLVRARMCRAKPSIIFLFWRFGVEKNLSAGSVLLVERRFLPGAEVW
jgi:hypothetical protein